MEIDKHLLVTQSEYDSRDIAVQLTIESLPPYVDLIPAVNEIENQEQTSSCTANAGCTALEIAYSRAGTPVDLSRMYLYWKIRELSGIRGDVGGYPRDIGKALLRYGVCEESEWGFTSENLNNPPPAYLDVAAAKYKISQYSRLLDSDMVKQIKTAVALGMPVLATMFVRSFFYSLSGKWTSHFWENVSESSGAHQVVIIGYDDASGRFLAQNSWGANWGDGGFFGIPYDMIEPKSVFEFWVLNKIGVDYKPADGMDLTPPLNIVYKEKSNTSMIVAMILLFVIGVLLLS